MKKAIYPGTFDPFTYGHFDVLTRAARIFEHVAIAVTDNQSKSPIFSVTERVELIRENIGHLSNVSVVSFRGLVVDFAKEIEAKALIRDCVRFRTSTTSFRWHR